MVESACKNGFPVKFLSLGRTNTIDDIDDSNCTDYIDFSENYLKELIDNKTCIFFEKGRALKNYLEIATLKPGFDRSKLIQRINEIYNLGNIDNEYITSFINNNSIATNKDEFNKFLNQLQLVKLKSENFCLPQQYVNYIIKQALEPDSIISKNPEMYLHLVECAIQDLGKNDLYQSIDEKYVYNFSDFVETSVLKGGKAGGYCDYYNKYIKLDRNDVKKLIEEKNIYILDTVFHENTHAEQHFHIENDNLDDYNRYVMLKEKILMAYYRDFYKDNYETSYIEIEAREKSALKLSRYIDSLGLSEQSCLSFLGAVGEAISKECENVVKREKGKYYTGKFKKISGKNQSVIEVFDNLIKQKPDILKKHPQLEIEYYIDKNGEVRKRSLEEILNCWMKSSNSSQIKLVSQIIKNGDIMTPDTFLDDMELLMEINTEDETNNEMIENIVYDNVLNQVWLLIGRTNNFDYKQLIKYRFILEKIQDRVKNFEDGFSRGMKKNYTDSGGTILEYIDILKEKIDGIIEKTDKADELEFESIKFLRDAGKGVSLEKLYEMENEFVERETKVRKHKQNSREKRRHNRIQKSNYYTKKNNEEIK